MTSAIRRKNTPLLRGGGVLVAILLLAGCERWYLDRLMHELCARDGGLKVYEQVKLPAVDFTAQGLPLARYAPMALNNPEDYLGPDYRYVEKREVLVGRGADPTKGQGRLIRTHTLIYRRADGRLLGESITYHRGGGDFFTFGFQPSGSHCPAPRPNLLTAVFQKN